MTEEKTCYNCGNKNCIVYYSTPKKDYKSHFETYEYRDFECVNHDKWVELMPKRKSSRRQRILNYENS